MQAFFLKLPHLVDKTTTFVADAIALWNPYLVKEQLRGVRRAHTQFLQRF
jgi:predicted transcriptional regulator